MKDDAGPKVTILYDGILPDLFREGQGIVAQGVLKERTTIEAFEVLAKHDEEYMLFWSCFFEAMKKTHEPMQCSTEQKKEVLNDSRRSATLPWSRP